MRCPLPAKSLLTVACFLLALFMAVLGGCSKLPAEYKTLRATDGEVRIPLSEVNDGKVHFYTYKKSGKRINLLVRTDCDGDLSVYFDACFTCYKHKKGYRDEGTDLVCNECSMRFGLADKKWDNTGGCSPILLKSTITDGFITIKTEHIEKGSKLFS
jgi:uncharacterized membrane protein